MKQLVLSDHTQAKIQEAAGRREAEHQAAGHAFQRIRRSRLQRRRGAWQGFLTAWRDAEIWPALRSAALLAFHLFPLEVFWFRPRRDKPGHEEEMWAVGNEGERLVVEHLARHFSNDWILLSGYRNRGGEIDQILVGPGGVFAMEVKHVNGEVHCNGDEWWRDKYDRYGNLVEQKVPMADRNGRAPSKQLNDAADALEAFLAREGGEVKVHRTVVLSHKSSKVGKLKKLTIDQVVTLDGWKPAKAFNRAQVFGGVATTRLMQAIQKDHEVHNQPRRR